MNLKKHLNRLLLCTLIGSQSVQIFGATFYNSNRFSVKNIVTPQSIPEVFINGGFSNSNRFSVSPMATTQTMGIGSSIFHSKNFSVFKLPTVEFTLNGEIFDTAGALYETSALKIHLTNHSELASVKYEIVDTSNNVVYTEELSKDVGTFENLVPLKDLEAGKTYHIAITFNLKDGLSSKKHSVHFTKNNRNALTILQPSNTILVPDTLTVTFEKSKTIKNEFFNLWLVDVDTNKRTKIGGNLAFASTLDKALDTEFEQHKYTFNVGDTMKDIKRFRLIVELLG